MGYISTTDVEGRLGTSLTPEQVSYFNEVLGPSIDAFLNESTYTVFDNDEQSEEYVSGNGSQMLVVPTMSEVTSLYSVSDDGTETLIDEASYVEYPKGKGYIYAIRNREGTWDDGFDNYKVVGKLGYSKIPADIKAIGVEMAISDLSVNINGYKSERVGDWSATYADSSSQSTLSQASMKVLEGYRRLSRSV